MKAKRFSRSRKTEAATGVCKKTTEHFFFFYCCFYYLGKRGLWQMRGLLKYNIFEVQKLKTAKTTKTQVHSQGGLQHFTGCFLCPTHSSQHAKPPLAGNREPELELFSSISRVVNYIVQVVLLLLESSLSFSFLWFFLPTELFQSPHLLLKVLMFIPRWGKKEKSLLCFLNT